MFSVLKKVFGGIVAIFVVIFIIGACSGESDEGSEMSGEGEDLIRECTSFEKCVTFASTGEEIKINRDCKAGDKIACRAIELVKEIEVKCKEGNTQLCAQAGRYLEWKQLSRIACGRNDGQGCYQVGQYEKGCELNHADSCFKAGEEGYGEQAVQFYRKGCDLKSAAACNNLGVKYAYGKDVERNYVTAKSYYDKACELGSKKGCENAKKIAKERGL